MRKNSAGPQNVPSEQRLAQLLHDDLQFRELAVHGLEVAQLEKCVDSPEAPPSSVDVTSADVVYLQQARAQSQALVDAVWTGRGRVTGVDRCNDHLEIVATL